MAGSGRPARAGGTLKTDLAVRAAMFGSGPLAGQGTSAPGDQAETLRRIDKNTADLLWWVKLMVLAVIALVILTALVL
jgi:hypothetical protein